MNWKIIGSEYISRHKYFTARKDTCETPGGHIVPQYFVVELPLTVCGVALTEDNEVLMVKQYRHPIEEVLLEIPGGFVDKDEEPVDAMSRELKEETGYEFSSYTYVGKIAANPGVLNNFTYFYLAKGGIKTSNQNLDENEEVEVEKISIAELKRLFLENEIMQATHNSCIFYALREMGEL